jgi:hypothetical protein
MRCDRSGDRAITGIARSTVGLTLGANGGGELRLADGILDRISHNAHRLQAEGRQFAQADGNAYRCRLTAVTGHGEITFDQRALRHPGQLRSEWPADIIEIRNN